MPADEASSHGVLAVEGLTTAFDTRAGRLVAVDDLSFALARGETLAIVGESGCGKSVAALSIMRLLETPPANILAGRVMLGDQDLVAADEAALRRIRGARLSMIFQEPMTALNPSMTVGRQIAEPLMRHRGLTRAAAGARAVELLAMVRIPEAERRAREYPHRLSGGMRQRVMIAIALACEPDVVIADEPTTALDVTIQAQILDTLKELQACMGSAVIMITHDLGVVAEVADRVVVMYAGRKVEEAPVAALFARPRHPYTSGLIRAVPRVTAPGRAAGRARLPEIPGMVPPPDQRPPGCPFAPRCALASPRCAAMPPLVEHAPGHRAACWHSDQVAAADAIGRAAQVGHA
jgi:peptide/nickel transport system ATP-binding protein